MEKRIKSKLWVDAHVRRCFAGGLPAFVIAKGDAERGGIILKINGFDRGVTVLEQALDFDGLRVWRRMGAGAGALATVSEADADASIRKRRSFDPDIWVIEIEDIKGTYTLDEPIEAL